MYGQAFPKLARQGSRAVGGASGVRVISWRGQCRDGGWCSLGIRHQFHGNQVARVKVVIPLPGLGDSITEGAVVSWEKSIGESVKVDDVIVVVETDKISIDIRSPNSGVLIEQHVAVDNNVEVGADLCTIHSDATGEEVIKSSTLDDEEETEPGQPTPPPAVEDDAGFATFSSGLGITEALHHHIPLIKFLGKRPKGTPKVRKFGHTPGALSIEQVVGGAMYGRPYTSQEEINAVNSGGAESAPLGNLKSKWMSE